MRVLICVKKDLSSHRYLVHLPTDILIQEIRSLISDNRHSHAITAALSKGLLERIVSDDEVGKIDADLILSENNARWDLC